MKIILQTIFVTTVLLMGLLATSLCFAQGIDTSRSEPSPRRQVNDRPMHMLDLPNTDLKAVFKMISEYSGIDIVVDDKVTGKISLKLQNKTWREVLSIVCRMKNLTTLSESGYIYVLTTDDYRQRMMEDAQSLMAEDLTETLQREVITCNNALASEMSDAVKSLISKRGSVTVVERNNALIIYDIPRNIELVKRLVVQLDVETQQVSISCKIIEVNSGVTQKIGIHWGVFTSIDGKSATAQHLPQKGFIPGAQDAFYYGLLSPSNFTAALEYLFNDANGEVVAQPQITTLDNKQARIFMGQQIPVTYLDEAGNTTIKMVDAGSEMIVTPHITGEGRVLLDLAPSKKSYFVDGGLPIINTQEAKTNVVVNDGETVVIAGLTANDDQKSETGIPILKDIPLIGNLFKKSEKTKTKRDLIIFVTPHIIKKNFDMPAQDVSAPVSDTIASTIQ